MVQEALRQPRITLTEEGFSLVSCGFFGTSQTYIFSFTLVNSGDGDGFANVRFVLDGTGRGNNNYFVPAGTSVDKSASLLVNDCVDHSPDIVLVASWKA